MAKKFYPSGFRLTLATAKKLAIQEFGTAKGLKKSEWIPSDGYYVMTLGKLDINIQPDISGSGCIHLNISMCDGPGSVFQLFDPETLNRDCKKEDLQRQKERREAFEEWVGNRGPEPCHKAIDDYWDGRR